MAHKQQQQTIQALIQANLYDTKIIPQLEEYVVYQCKHNHCDPSSNRELLKLYAIAPDHVKLDILVKLLIKSMMELPQPDFTTNLYLIPERLHSEDAVKTLIRLQGLLEVGEFNKFWKDYEQHAKMFADVAGFEDTIRKFITVTTSITFSSIAPELLKKLWNLSDKSSFESAVQSAGWSFSSDRSTVLVSRQDDKPTRELRQEHPTVEQIAKLLPSFN